MRIHVSRLPFPMPGDRYREGWSIAPSNLNEGERTVVASVTYIDDSRGEIALVLLLEREAPYFTVAHLALTEFDPKRGDITDGGEPMFVGELDVIGRFSNIVEAIREYEQSGGDI